MGADVTYSTIAAGSFFAPGAPHTPYEGTIQVAHIPLWPLGSSGLSVLGRVDADGSWQDLNASVGALLNLSKSTVEWVGTAFQKTGSSSGHRNESQNVGTHPYGAIPLPLDFAIVHDIGGTDNLTTAGVQQQLSHAYHFDPLIPSRSRLLITSTTASQGRNPTYTTKYQVIDTAGGLVQQ